MNCSINITCSQADLLRKHCGVPMNICWYSEYLHLNRLVEEGEIVQICQKIGTMKNITVFDPHLHFGIGDGDPACWYDGVTAAHVIGNTVDFDNFFCSPLTGRAIPHTGSRAPSLPGPTPHNFTEQQLQFIRCHTQALTWRRSNPSNKKKGPSLPINPSKCDWHLFFGSAFHYGCEYYTLDWTCPSFSDNIGKDVFCACGGCSVTSKVIFSRDIGPSGSLGGLIIIQHSTFPCDYPAFPPPFAESPEFFLCCMPYGQTFDFKKKEVKMM